MACCTHRPSGTPRPAPLSASCVQGRSADTSSTSALKSNTRCRWTLDWPGRPLPAGTNYADGCQKWIDGQPNRGQDQLAKCRHCGASREPVRASPVGQSSIQWGSRVGDDDGAVQGPPAGGGLTDSHSAGQVGTLMLRPRHQHQLVSQIGEQNKGSRPTP